MVHQDELQSSQSFAMWTVCSPTSLHHLLNQHCHFHQLYTLATVGGLVLSFAGLQIYSLLPTRVCNYYKKLLLKLFIFPFKLQPQLLKQDLHSPGNFNNSSVIYF
jgi:hypothetical protein